MCKICESADITLSCQTHKSKSNSMLLCNNTNIALDILLSESTAFATMLDYAAKEAIIKQNMFVYFIKFMGHSDIRDT